MGYHLFQNLYGNGAKNTKCLIKTLEMRKLNFHKVQIFILSGLIENEGSFKGKPGEIPIPDTSADTMEKVLFFMYHDTIDKSKIDFDLLKAADKYLMDNLVTYCIEHLESNLTLDNALDIMMAAYQINQNSLFEAATNFVWNNKGKLTTTDSWNKMLKAHTDLIAKAFNSILAKK